MQRLLPQQSMHHLHLYLIEFDLRAYSGSACTSGFATHVETRSPPQFNYTILMLIKHVEPFFQHTTKGLWAKIVAILHHGDQPKTW